MALAQTINYQIARSLRTLYYVRAAFNVIWVTLISIYASSSPDITATLLIIYPIWDVAGTIADILINRGSGSLTPQYVNLGMSAIAAIAVNIAIRQGVPQALIVFGIWAMIAGIIQLIMGLQRQKTVGGQWPIIISGGQSTIGGLSFIILAKWPTLGIASLAGYSAFGAFYFLLAAITITKRLRKGY
jgi:hypothetical protein